MINEKRTSCAERELEAFIREHQDDFYRLAFSYVKNADEAMDVIQEAAIKRLCICPLFGIHRI